MNVALVFPPQGHFTQPYLSLPSLAAYLRQHGTGHVEMIDASIDSYDHFLSRDRLQRSLQRVRAGEGLADLEARERLGFSEIERYQRLSEIALIGEEVVARIDEAKRVLRSEGEFYDYERYLWAGRTIEQGLRLFSAEYAPTRLSAHGFVMQNRIERSAEIVAALDCERENPYLEYFRQVTLPRIQALDPALVGISVTFPSQAIPSLTLARLLKRWKPELHITLGGGLLAYVAEKLAKRDEVWSLIDSFVMLEGEGPLLALVEALDGQRTIDSVPNLIWRDRSGTVRSNVRSEPLDIKKLPVPDFDGLPLDKYLSPELVLPLAATRGCYWGKCVFCTLYTVIGPGYRGRTVEQTVEDMSALQQKYGVNKFYLAIEDLPPNMARALPRAIKEARLGVRWWADARLEHEVFTQDVCDDLAEAGCLRLAFGYESASKRVLNRMCKGIDPVQSIEILRRVRQAGISVTLYVMIGFPTETREEADLTLRTVLEHRDLIQEVSARVFYLDESSELYRRRAEFEIDEVYPDEQADLQVYYDFRTRAGMTRREARDVYLNFMREVRSHFPVFQNTNMLYHELKSHYFLFLARHGSWERLCQEVLEPGAHAAPPGVSPGAPHATSTLRPAPRAAHRKLRLAFDRGEIDQRLSGVDSFTLRPRYQSDLIEAADRERLDREFEPQTRGESVLLFDPRSGEVHSLSPAAAELLERCDGVRTLEQVVELVPAAHRPAARDCVAELARAGMLSPLPMEVMQR